jgi:hypothetical protein
VLRGQLDLALATLHKIIESSSSHSAAGAGAAAGLYADALDGGSSSEQQVGWDIALMCCCKYSWSHSRGVLVELLSQCMAAGVPDCAYLGK